MIRSRCVFQDSLSGLLLTVVPILLCVKPNHVPALLQATHPKHLAWNTWVFARPPCAGCVEKTLARVENQIRHSVTGPWEAPAIPFNVLELAVQTGWLRHHFALVQTCVCEPPSPRVQAEVIETPSDRNPRKLEQAGHTDENGAHYDSGSAECGPHAVSVLKRSGCIVTNPDVPRSLSPSQKRHGLMLLQQCGRARGVALIHPGRKNKSPVRAGRPFLGDGARGS